MRHSNTISRQLPTGAILATSTGGKNLLCYRYTCLTLVTKSLLLKDDTIDISYVC